MNTRYSTHTAHDGRTKKSSFNMLDTECARVSTGAMRATLQRSYVHPAGLAAANQGSMQVLADGEVLVGWGNLPYFSQFTPDGMLKFVLKATAADEVLRSLRTTLEQLASEEAASEVRSVANEKHS